jgi:hypothetical protein
MKLQIRILAYAIFKYVGNSINKIPKIIKIKEETAVMLKPAYLLDLNTAILQQNAQGC